MKLEAEHKVAQLTDDISVLVVDDNEINLMLMEDILDVMDIKKVKTLESGIEAIKEIENNPNYDVVVMDICMPVMDGYQSLMGIRNLEKQRNIPEDEAVKVIMTTALNEERNVKMAFELGCTIYSGKPIDQERFEQALKKLNLI